MNTTQKFLLTTIGLVLIISMVTALNNNYTLNENLITGKLLYGIDENVYFNKPLTSIDCTNPPNCSFTVEGDILSDMNFYARWFGNEFRVYLEWTPNFCQAGQYNFRIHFWDGSNYVGHSDNSITVNNVNRPPTISVLPLYQEVLKGSTATVNITATDPDYTECGYNDDHITLDVVDERGGILTDNGDGTGTFIWTPDSSANTTTPYNFVFTATDNFEGSDNNTAQIQVRTLCGDASNDGKVNVSDVITLINYLFKGGTAPADLDAADVNNDGKVNVSDVIYLINYLFKGGTAPNCGY